ncbi:hypothetical protein MMC13_004880 [Lambiella insularis]|nr:hypothetical protein [Lambiella insularis]
MQRPRPLPRSVLHEPYAVEIVERIAHECRRYYDDSAPLGKRTLYWRRKENQIAPLGGPVRSRDYGRDIHGQQLVAGPVLACNGAEAHLGRELEDGACDDDVTALARQPGRDFVLDRRGVGIWGRVPSRLEKRHLWVPLT